MNVLFVCSRNKWRSPTAEAIYKERHDHHFRSAGTEPSAKVRVSSKAILWADMIFAMEKKHRERLLDKFPSETGNKLIVVLDIADDYGYMDQELINMIRISVDPYL